MKGENISGLDSVVGYQKLRGSLVLKTDPSGGKGEFSNKHRRELQLSKTR